MLQSTVFNMYIINFRKDRENLKAVIESCVAIKCLQYLNVQEVLFPFIMPYNWWTTDDYFTFTYCVPRTMVEIWWEAIIKVMIR